uniref:Ribosomal protein S8 n=1 Tax=Navicula veneta TaxID=138539 RepID=A0A8F0WGJ8_9STRA|nr:ribosomal protein S8 [Navicula veneta]QWM93634.1 ribosomal protein S8 [Navicula veneta]
MKNHFWNMFTNVRNGQLAKRSFIYQKKIILCEAFLKILWDEGFIVGYKISKKNNDLIKIFLKYTYDGKPTINCMKLVTKPGRRVSYSIKQIWKIDSSKNFIIFSTNKGLKTINDCKRLKIGGEPFILIN